MNASKRKAHRDSDQKAAKRRRLTSDNVSKLINVASVMPGDDLCASEEDDQDNDDISDHDSDEQEDNISEGLTSVGRFPRRRATADDRETDNDGYIQSQRNRNVSMQGRRVPFSYRRSDHSIGESHYSRKARSLRVCLAAKSSSCILMSITSCDIMPLKAL